MGENDVITLIHTEIKTDEYGDSRTVERTREVFAQYMSIGQLNGGEAIGT